MKTIKNTLLIALMLVSGLVSAQTDKYTAAMKKGVAMLDSARDEQSFLAAANYFERVANVETTQWLPTYYAAYANLYTALTSADQSKKDGMYDKVLDLMNKADGISANNSEILALKGYAQFMKMSVDPPSRLGLIGEANAALAKAKAIDPANPRPYFILAQNTFYTPEAFGGGKNRAKPMLDESAGKYLSVSSNDAIAPHWGEKACLTLLEKCK